MNPEPEFPRPNDLGEPLKKMLSAWNVCSKEWIIRQYDHEVQGGSVVKPLVGAGADGPAGAGGAAGAAGRSRWPRTWSSA